jgi:hypothetical protein
MPARSTDIEVGVLDSTGPGLNRIGARFRDLSTGIARVADSSGLSRLGTSFGSIGRAVTEVREAALPAIDALSTIAGIGTGVGLVALAEKLRDSAEAVQDFVKQGQLLKIAPQALRQFAEVANLQDISWQETRSALENANSAYINVRANIGRTTHSLQLLRPELVGQLRGAHNSSEAFGIMIKSIHDLIAIGQEAKANRLSEILFGTVDFTRIARMSADEFDAAMQRAGIVVGKFTTEQMENVRKSGDKLKELGAVFSSLGEALAIEVYPILGQGFANITEELLKHRTEIVAGLTEMTTSAIDWANSVHWRELGINLRYYADTVNHVAQELGGWKVVMLGILGLKLAPTALALFELAKGFGSLGLALATTPVGQIALIAGAGYLLYQNWDKVGPVMRDAAEAIGITGPQLDYMASVWKAHGPDFQIDLFGNTVRELTKLKELIDDATHWLYPFLDRLAGFSPSAYVKSVIGAPVNEGIRTVQPHTGRAFGGPVNAGDTTWVGERGRELVHWGSSGTVIPNNQIPANDNMMTGNWRLLSALSGMMTGPFSQVTSTITDLNRSVRELIDILKGRGRGGIGRGTGGAERGGGSFGPGLGGPPMEGRSGFLPPRSLSGAGPFNAPHTYAHGAMAPDASGAAPVPGGAGTYRPIYKLGSADLSDAVVRTVAGEARMSSPRGIDAVINNMFNRLGSKGYGPSGNLLQVASAPGQYEGFNRGRPNRQQSDYIKDRIRAIAAGEVEDITKGANEYRASYYVYGEGRNRTWARTMGIPHGTNIGGNIFARNPQTGNTPFAPYEHPNVMAANASKVMRDHLDNIEQARQQKVALEGRAAVDVRLSHDGSISGVSAQSEGHVLANVGVDKTGSRVFRPAPVVRDPQFAHGGAR